MQPKVVSLSHMFRSTSTRSLIAPLVRRVCDDEGGGCFNVTLVRPIDENGRVSSGPSGDVYRGAWDDQHYLLPIFRHALKGTCTRRDGSRKTVVDVGANIGLYGLYFASQGCEVHAMEALPLNAEHLQHSITINGFQNRFVLHRRAVSVKDTGSVTMRFNAFETGLSHVVVPMHQKDNGYYRQRKVNRNLRNWTEVAVHCARLETLLINAGHVDLGATVQ